MQQPNFRGFDRCFGYSVGKSFQLQKAHPPAADPPEKNRAGLFEPENRQADRDFSRHCIICVSQLIIFVISYNKINSLNQCIFMDGIRRRRATAVAVTHKKGILTEIAIISDLPLNEDKISDCCCSRITMHYLKMIDRRILFRIVTLVTAQRSWKASPLDMFYGRRCVSALFAFNSVPSPFFCLAG